MAVKPGVISDLQASEMIYSNDKLTLCFDATTQEGVHVNAIHVTAEHASYICSLEQLPGV